MHQLMLHVSLRRAVGLIYVSTRNTIIGGKLCILVLPVSPFPPCDARGISRYPHPEVESCIYIDSFCEGTGIWSALFFRLGLSVGFSKLEFLGQIALFERRLRGAAPTPLALPYPFCTST